MLCQRPELTKHLQQLLAAVLCTLARQLGDDFALDGRQVDRLRGRVRVGVRLDLADDTALVLEYVVAVEAELACCLVQTGFPCCGLLFGLGFGLGLAALAAVRHTYALRLHLDRGPRGAVCVDLAS